jgi:hypothetical protein
MAVAITTNMWAPLQHPSRLVPQQMWRAYVESEGVVVCTAVLSDLSIEFSGDSGMASLVA